MNIWFNTLIYIYISSHHLFIKPLTKEKFIVYGVGHGLSVLFSPFISEILLMNV